MSRKIYILYLLLLGFGFLGFSQTGYLTPVDSSEYILNPMIKNILYEAKGMLGKPYKYGALSDTAVDCSGFTLSVYKKGAEIKIPRTSSSQSKAGKEVPFYNLEPGDLLFFATGPKRNQVTHVAIVYNVNNSEVAFIHASTSKGVCIDTLSKKPWNNSVLTARRIIP
ncbi:MAG: C40 family peptidase [Chitinophagaceae bacterium]